MDMPSEQVENAKKAVLDIFKENDNQPLNKTGLVRLVRQKLGNGNFVTEEFVTAVIEKMLDRFELREEPSGKISLNE